jgi:DNA-binding transcriptional regulator YiaG
MAYLSEQWRTHRRDPNPPRHYTDQREFEADWVFTLRRRHALSQEALASLARVSVTTVQNWENPRSLKAIAEHNQNLLRDLERELWMKAHVSVLAPCPPTIRAIHDLLAASRDESAQALADYLVSSMESSSPERARLLHWACLAHGIADPASPRARDYGMHALAAVGQGDSRLSAAIENEILGFQMQDLLNMKRGPERADKGLELMRACERLYARDPQRAYAWNALEVACRAPLPTEHVFRLARQLIDLLGEDAVRRRVATEEAYTAARALFEAEGRSH